MSIVGPELYGKKGIRIELTFYKPSSFPSCQGYQDGGLSETPEGIKAANLGIMSRLRDGL